MTTAPNMHDDPTPGDLRRARMWLKAAINSPVYELVKITTGFSSEWTVGFENMLTHIEAASRPNLECDEYLVLYLSFTEPPMPQEEIAERLVISDRQVRNILKSAVRKVAIRVRDVDDRALIEPLVSKN